MGHGERDARRPLRAPGGRWAPRAAPSSAAWQLAMRIVLMTLGLLVAAWLFYTLRAIVLDLVVALILATGLHPLVSQLRRAGLPRGLSVLLIYFTFLALLLAFAVAVIQPALSQLDSLIRNAPGYGRALGTAVQELAARFPILKGLDAQLIRQLQNLGSQLDVLASQALKLVDLLLNVFGGLASLLFILLMTYYLIVDGQRIRDYCLSFVAQRQRQRLTDLTDRIAARMGRWLIGEVTICATVGLTAYIGLSAIGIPGALILGLVAAVGEFIPNIGPLLSVIPAALVAMTQSSLKVALVLGLFLLIHQLDFLLLVPKVMQHAVSIHPLAVVLALLVGGTLLGLPGALVAVPVATAASVVLDELRHVPTNAASTDAPVKPAKPLVDAMPPQPDAQRTPG